jgi:hypothetical protein
MSDQRKMSSISKQIRLYGNDIFATASRKNSSKLNEFHNFDSIQHIKDSMDENYKTLGKLSKAISEKDKMFNKFISYEKER